MADQIISRLEYVHLQSFIHLDTKPENILLKTRKCAGHVRTADLELFESYGEPATNLHIPCSDKEKLTCAAGYARIRSHLDIQQSRRDGIKSPG